ncbi:unnamed protein product [Ceratitis capitata]|uniref:(Mediterranean fruit fly) hypothetical protein n=1 Tax=Ceratitis capitata TaxID=7213 RepID=A0A811UYA5_CERCA|nr:unnamed protein product [Ceratitis capitata]
MKTKNAWQRQSAKPRLMRLLRCSHQLLWRYSAINITSQTTGITTTVDVQQQLHFGKISTECRAIRRATAGLKGSKDRLAAQQQTKIKTATAIITQQQRETMPATTIVAIHNIVVVVVVVVVVVYLLSICAPSMPCTTERLHKSTTATILTSTTTIEWKQPAGNCPAATTPDTPEAMQSSKQTFLFLPHSSNNNNNSNSISNNGKM